MRRLRFKIAGHLFALALRVLPSGRIKTTLIEAVADWRDELENELEMPEVRDCTR